MQSLSQCKLPRVLLMAPDVSLHCYMDYSSHSANTSRCAFHTRKGKGGSRSSESIKNTDFSLSLELCMPEQTERLVELG